jgi:hypothetical protein
MNFLILQTLAASIVTGTLVNPLLAIQTSTTFNQSFLSDAVAQAPSELDRWVDDLVQLESEGRTNLRIVDANGYYSYGCLQFQKRTFEKYGLMYNVITNDDLPNVKKLIYDCELQKKLAKLMIEDYYGNWRKWYTSVTKKGLGLPPKDEILTLASTGK